MLSRAAKVSAMTLPGKRVATPSSRRAPRLPPRLVGLVGCAAALAVSAAELPSVSAGPKAAPALLVYAQAQKYVLGLVNRDREKAGLRPVVLDDTASKAGLSHARDMARKGFTGHLGSDGSTPEQRYSESGGSDFVQENAACLADTVERPLDDKPRFDPAKLAALHAMFMAELPPNDGHRRNVLNPLHNRLGIGIAEPLELGQPCLTQEFVDDYGDYVALPREAKRKATLHVEGTIAPSLVFGGVGLGRTPLPQPLPRERLNGKQYRIPTPDTLYFPAGFKTPKPVTVSGRHFSIDLELGSDSGSYAVTIWAKKPSAPELFMISLRTLTVR
jgi:uncharacterized protein YkwD